MTKNTRKPSPIDDAALDDASGGLLPAVNVARDAGNKGTSTTSTQSANNLKQISIGVHNTTD